MPVIDIEYQLLHRGEPLFGFVKYFWKLTNHSAAAKSVIIVPDGCFDIIWSLSQTEPFHVVLNGLATGPEQAVIPPNTIMCAVSFNLPAVEYLLHTSIASLVAKTAFLPVDFWNIEQSDLNNFEHFCNKLSQKLVTLKSEDMDNRKLELFEHMYATEGSITIKELSTKVYWSSRQINRYFTQWFGMPLKTYCNILRYRASFKQIKEGKFFPEQNFADQAHFIKNVKRYTGVTPKEISKNENDRFIQFLVLPEK